MTAKQSLKTKKSDRCQTLLSSIDWISKFQMNRVYGLQELGTHHVQHSLWLIHSFTPTRITWYIIIRKLRGTFVTMGRARAFGRNRRTKLQAKTAVFDAKKSRLQQEEDRSRDQRAVVIIIVIIIVIKTSYI